MTRVTPRALPEASLLRRYGHPAGYVDCYAVESPARIALASFVEAFYTTPLFRVERLILKTMAARPSTDARARAIGSGEGTSFAAWSVESRTADQLLLRDFTGRTRSWFMAIALPGGAGTRLLFGSAVAAVSRGHDAPRMGASFRALLGFHRLYSRMLLAAAGRRLAAAGHAQA